jgi:hypothetical protein
MTKTASGLYVEHAIQDTFACVKINPGNYVQVPIIKMLRPVMQHNAPLQLRWVQLYVLHEVTQHTSNYYITWQFHNVIVANMMSHDASITQPDHHITSSVT